jgi:hypothetical protein
MIDKYYHDINILRFNKGGFGEPSGYEIAGTFKGLVQTPSNSNTFNNGKDTSSVAGVLFCPITVKFESKDIIEDNGQKYIISGQNTQNNGVTGITPKAGQHAEYRLEWTQENV